MKDTFENGTGLITSSHLVRWTELKKREAEQVFPELVRRLLDVTPEASEIHMRAGDSVVLGGYDGSALMAEGNNLLPPGKLVFELGTSKDIRQKAFDDFKSRRSKAVADETFVFATPRRWQGKEDWAAQRRSEGVFKDVRVLDADDFEHWLQLAPLVQIWFSEHLEIDLQGAEKLSVWWARFSGSTEPALPKSLFTAGREVEARKLLDFVGGQAGRLVIEAPSSDDILGFLLAVLDQEGRNEFLESVIVDSKALWYHICSLSGPGILIPTFSSPDVRRAVDSGKHVVIAKDYSKSRIHTSGLFLPPVNRTIAEEALVSAGFGVEEGKKLAALARRSLPALKRRVSLIPDERSSVWTDHSSASVLSGLFVAGRWRENPGDLEILEQMTRLGTADLAAQLADFKDGADPILWNSGEVWSFVSAEEAFGELLPRFNPHLQESWVSVAIEVLTEPDPLEGLDQIQRALSNDPGRKYSKELRRGIAESIAILASAEDGDLGPSLRVSVPHRVVTEVMRRVQDPKAKLSWVGIADILPILAEGNPEALLMTLENDLDNDEPTVATLFEEFHNPLGFGPTVHYPALLSALEILCWNPEYITRSIRVLTRLADFTVPANLANTPLASMGAVLCAWLPRSTLDNETRLDLVDSCFQISPNTGRALLKEIWPSGHSMVFSPVKPRYRDWLASTTGVTYGQLFEFVDLLAERVIAWATDEPGYLKWMIEAIETSASINASNRLFGYLESQATADTLGSSNRLDLLASVSAAVVKHERYSEASWSMPVESRQRLKALQDLLDPADLYSQALFIFEWDPVLDGVGRSDSEYQEKLDQTRLDVVEKILAMPSGWGVLEEITKRIEDSGGVGRAIPLEGGFQTLDRLTGWLESEDSQLKWAASVWVRSWLDKNGPATLNAVLERETLTDVARKAFVHCVPQSGPYWDVLTAWPDEHFEYWQHGRFDIVDTEYLSEATQELLRHGRGSTAAIIVAHTLHLHRLRGLAEVDVDIVISSLRGAVSSRDDLQRLDPYQVGEMLNYLEDKSVDQDTLAGLEFTFFSWLEDFHEPRALNRLLASDPNLFVELVCQAYRERNAATNEPGKEPDSSRAQAAWSVLNDWHGFPGCDDNRSLDPQLLEYWVSEARKKLRELGRADIGDQCIGRTFVNVPKGSDGIWPEEPIRDLIESLSSPQIETGMVWGQLNSRGATSRDIYEGGAQERILANRYLADSRAIEVKWPRTAAVLREIGRRYEHDASREDMQAAVAQDFD